MPPNLQFAFLGCQHNYLAKVTNVNSDGVPLDDSLPRTYGLPTAFVNRMSDQVRRTRAYYDIRGHDFLSHSGHWRGGEGTGHVGYVNTASVLISESPFLESLRLENEQHKSSLKNKSKYSGLSMTICLGPGSGSLFVDAYKLERYEWETLPLDLRRVVGRLHQNGYKKCGIWDMQMSALGGWVILLNKGKDFLFGGDLPYELKILLQDIQKRKSKSPKMDTSIYRIYLNHQHPDEYVLVFGDGQCFVKLHSDFEPDIRALLSEWGENETHPKFHVTFTSSSTTPKACQQVLNAAYYSRRGLFFLSRLNESQALLYLREAADLDRRSPQIRENYCMAIIGRLAGMRRNHEPDLELEDQIRNRPAQIHTHRSPPPRMDKDAKAFFRAEYMWMLDEKDVDVPELERKLDALQRPCLDGRWHLAPLEEKSKDDWSYERAVAGNEVLLCELETREVVVEDVNAPVEAPAEEVLVVGRTVTGVSELSSVDEIERYKEVASELGPGKKYILLDPPVFDKPFKGGPFFAGFLKYLR